MRYLLFFILLSLNNLFIAQETIDFDHYITLQSKGKLPEILTTTLTNQVAKDLKEGKFIFANEEDKKDFLIEAYSRLTHYLYSGNCSFGDPVSVYIEMVTKKMFASKPALLRNLEFVTVKSNDAFVLSAYPKTILVSTGLISQLTSEAQLAYLLASAVAKIELNIDQQLFALDIQNKTSQYQKIEQVPLNFQYSCDSLGLIYYQAAKYNLQEVNTAFLASLYSYLPFEDRPFDVTYFNTDLYFVPETFFSSKNYNLKSEEELMPMKTGYKELIQRRMHVELLVDKLNTIDTARFQLSPETFSAIRKACRFETLRLQVMNNLLGEAIYTCFLLEKEHPNSLFIAQMKALTWSLIIESRSKAKMSFNFIESKCEGEICKLLHFLKSSDQNAVVTLGFRNIRDLQQKFPADQMIRKAYEKSLLTLASQDWFDMNAYGTKTYNQAILDFEAKKNAPSQNEVPNSKYDKISSKRLTSASFDSLDYPLFGLSDLAKDSKFLQRFKSIQDSLKANSDRVNLANMTPKERYAYQQEQEKKEREAKKKNINIHEVLAINPKITFQFLAKFDPEQRDDYENQLIHVLGQHAEKENVKLQVIGKKDMQTGGVKEFNTICLYQTIEKQLETLNRTAYIPVDYALLHEKQMNDHQEAILFVQLIQTPSKNIQLKMIVYNLLTNKVVLTETETIPGKPNKTTYSLYLYHFFNKFN